MICISIAEKTPDSCLRALIGAKLAEIRIDALSAPERAGVERIFKGRKATKLIATCRPGRLSEEKRKSLLLCAISSGASYVDIEVDASDAYKQEISAAAKKGGCKLIVSFHDYKRTQPREELLQIVGWCFESGADICKIACKANSGKDSARLLGLLDNEKKIVVAGMGKEGRITRIAAPLLGSPFTYASQGKGKETAEGQIGREEMEKLMKGIGDA